MLNQLHPDSSAYTILNATRVRSELDLPVLARALAHLLVRHDWLASTFDEVHGQPCRFPLDPQMIRLDVRDVGPVTEQELYAQVRALARRQFALATEAPFRISLLRRTPADTALVLTFHHIVADATSQALVLRDLLDGYARLLADPTSAPEVPRSGYAEYVQAEQALLASPRGARMARYWRQLRTGAETATLPTDRPRPRLSARSGASCLIGLPPAAGSGVRRAAERLDVTPFALLLGVFQVLVHCYTGRQAQVLACNASNRTSPATRELVGYLVNPLLVRFEIGTTSTFTEVIRLAQRQILTGLANIGYPTMLDNGHPGMQAPNLAFTLIAVDRLRPHLPFAPSGGVLGPEVSYRGLRLTKIDLPHMEGQFDLNAEVRLDGDQLSVVFRYDVELFDHATVARFGTSFARLLGTALADLDARVGRVSLLDHAELQQLATFGSRLPTAAAAPTLTGYPAGAGPSRAAYTGVLAAIGQTPLVRLHHLWPQSGHRVFAKLEQANPGGSIKDRSAASMLLGAIERGEVVSGRSVVIESSSGNLAIGLAQICRYHGIRFICVVDAKTTAHNLAILHAYGAEIEVITEPDADTGEYLPVRLRRIRELVASTPDAFCPNQYANPLNPAAHAQTMAEIIEALDGEPDYLFLATSTTGTLRGCASYLRSQGLRTTVVAVDAVGSVLFGQPPRRRLLPGHGASIRPPLLQPEAASRIVHVDDRECVLGCRRLMHAEAILAGASSGAVVAAADRLVAELAPDSTVVLLLADGGDRYLDTVYSDDWVQRQFGDLGGAWLLPPAGLALQTT
ncbi:2,3-diaminopropionate biosynthesis protein SbnA [Frankia sp. Ag45/Mut15]|uniref:N-(2-amino-2-carboxyethyl)-L-glutamate synthase n=1 Tax=Frankia umida TaxID=573489 RepID=A0ABT0K209_9ACTN|nr:2,3-diaminopropionate biosynthesis protein SbnA [Frankia umida]